MLSPSSDCWVFCLNWFGLGLFCFLLFLIVQTELICSQLWKIQGTMKTSASQDFHQAISIAWQHPLCVEGRAGWGNWKSQVMPLVGKVWSFPTETRLHCTVVWGWSRYLPPHVTVNAATFRGADEKSREQSLKTSTGDCTGPGREWAQPWGSAGLSEPRPGPQGRLWAVTRERAAHT